MRRKNRPTTQVSKTGSRQRAKIPRTVAQYHAMPEKSKDTMERVVKALSKLRSEKASLKKASLEAGVSPKTVKRWAGSALEKGSSGRYTPKRSDQLLRILKVPDAKGTREIAVRGSRQATLLAEYWNAVHKFLASGDTSDLRKFRGKSVKDADGREIPLLSDRAELNRLGNASVISFESLYVRST